MSSRAPRDAFRRAILVNGPPASGKTTVAQALAQTLGWPLLSRDTVKEVLFDALGSPDREANRRLGRVSQEIVWSVLADFPVSQDVIIDAWFGRAPHEATAEGLARARVGRSVEVWCHAPGEVLAARYAARVGARHPAHPDASYLPELVELAGLAEPMALGPVLRVETADLGAVDIGAIVSWAQARLALDP